MANELTTKNGTGAVEQALIAGNLANLSEGQRLDYYRQVCESTGLNPLTQPFAYITLNGKLTLYARKDATDQLRKIHGVSIGKPDITFQDDLIIVAVTGRDKTGREDSELGVVKKTDMRGDMANALMKALTKAKRRLTLSICGLGMLDETEIETIPAEVVSHPVSAIENKPEPKPAAKPSGKPNGDQMANMPRNGLELRERLANYDAKLGKQGVCAMGQLMDHIAALGQKAGWGGDISKWQGDEAMLAAAEWTKEFEKSKRQRKAS